jgi:CRP-like cAMP-binding protein
MIRVIVLRDLGPLELVVPVQEVADLVMRGITSRAAVPRMIRAIEEMPLFRGMTMEQAERLAGVCQVQEIESGTEIFCAAGPADSLYLLLDGEVAITGGAPAGPIGTVRKGETFGEISLLAQAPHSATATAASHVEAAVLPYQDLMELIRRRPDIGVIIYRNLAVGLGEKLQRSSRAVRERG